MKIYIVLTREDLIEWKRDTPINGIEITDFKDTFNIIQSIEQADFVIFEDENETKFLKHR